MKKISIGITLICFSYFSFSVYIPELQTEPNVFEPQISKAILSYQGSAVCEVDTVKYPSLVPSHLDVITQSESHQTKPKLPECDVEDMNRIYHIAQNAVFVDSAKKGVEIAGLFTSVELMCVAVAVSAGTMVYFMNEENIKMDLTSTLSKYEESMTYGSVLGLVSGLLMQVSKKVTFSTIPISVICGGVGAFTVDYIYQTRDLKKDLDDLRQNWRQFLNRHLKPNT